MTCPHCTYQFETEEAGGVGAELLCPQCDLRFWVSNLSPLEFDIAPPEKLTNPLLPNALIRGWIFEHLNRSEVSTLVDHAFTQGCAEITLKVSFTDRYEDEVTMEIADVG